MRKDYNGADLFSSFRGRSSWLRLKEKDNYTPKNLKETWNFVETVLHSVEDICNVPKDKAKKI